MVIGDGGETVFPDEVILAARRALVRELKLEKILIRPIATCHAQHCTASTDAVTLSHVIRPIVICGDPVLHNPTAPAATPLDPQLIADMFETMYTANGVGLAANQIGIGESFFVFDCEGVKGVVVNPTLETSEIPETMPDEEEDQEGCLSLPGEFFPTGRADWAKVTGTDENGNPVEFEGEGFLARCFQHECGHLEGKVYTDMTIGRWRREAKRAIRDNGWKEPGQTWLPDPKDSVLLDK